MSRSVIAQELCRRALLGCILRVDIEFPKFLPQRVAVEAEEIGCLGLVSAAAFEGLADHGSFDRFDSAAV